MRQRRRRGFTLIELVASAVLAAMMMAALFGIVWSSVRETRQLRQAERTRWPTTQLVTQMRRDFRNARGMLVTSSGVTLHGFLDQDMAGRTPTLRIGRVQYEAVRLGGRGILVRRTTDLQGARTEPAWVGFSSLRIEPLEVVDSEDDVLDLPEAGGLPLVPSSFRVTLLGDEGNLLWREVIDHHAS